MSDPWVLPSADVLSDCYTMFDLLACLLLICRENKAELLSELRSSDGPAQVSRYFGDYTLWLSDGPVLTQPMRTKIYEELISTNALLRVRALALAVTQKAKEQIIAQSADRGSFKLELNTPIITATPNITRLYPERHYTVRPENRPDEFGVDRVPLMRLADKYPITVYYDSHAGSHLDVTMLEDRSIVLAAGQLNEHFTEFAEAERQNGTFFGYSPKDATQQQEKIEDVLTAASEAKVTLLCLPELTHTADILRKVLQKVKAGDLSTPPIVVLGSAHVSRGKRRLNRATVLYRQPHYIVTHDKIARFTLRVANEVYQEGITSGRRITVHSGQYATLIVLICADALDVNIQNLIADLRPHYIAIPCMTAKTEPFEAVAERWVDAGQTTVLLANGPRDQQATAASALFGRPVRDGRVLLGRHDAVPGLILLEPGRDEVTYREI